MPAVPMSSPSAEEVIDAFIEVVRDELANDNAVEVPSLGTFAVEHRPSALERTDDGHALAPPRNAVVFTPDTE